MTADPTIPLVLVWMDLEMTGLDPGRNVIVEIATLVTDDELEIVADGPDLVVHQPPEALAAMEDIVRAMHTSQRTPEGDRGVDRLARRRRTPDTRRSSSSTSPRPARCRCAATRSEPIGASSRPICRRSRSTCTTGRSTCRRSRNWRSGGSRRSAPPRPAKAGSHRALGDIQESVAELQYYRGRGVQANGLRSRPRHETRLRT